MVFQLQPKHFLDVRHVSSAPLLNDHLRLVALGDQLGHEWVWLGQDFLPDGRVIETQGLKEVLRGRPPLAVVLDRVTGHVAQPAVRQVNLGEGDGLILGALQKDQKVALKEAGGGYQIGVVQGVPLGHKVVEVGSDYVVLEDIAGITETRIPIYAIRAVTVTRIEKQK